MTEIFKDPQFAASFTPRYGGMVVNLTEEATTALVKNYIGKNSKGKMFILLTFEGDLDPNWPFEHDWKKVVRRVTEAQLLVYNARTKRCARPVWHQEPANRTKKNYSWERVKLFPVERIINAATLPPNARVVINT